MRTHAEIEPHLHQISPTSPLYLPCISPASPLYLPCISPASPLCQVKKNDEIEMHCLEMEDKVKLVLANHKMVHESLNRSYGHARLEP